MFVAGPCSAEAREQVLLTARLIKDACGDTPYIFRAGAWKPRTSPESFQGAGEDALTWLAEVQQTYGIPTATEVATPDHVREALFAGIAYLWIGARTSANPIAVQAIADTIRKTRRKPKGVLVKNPVSEDAQLWLGNIARLEQTSLPVIAVHRGCNHKPCWAMAHTVRQARPELPLLIDPSHMSGDALQVPELLHKAAELHYDGAMIEVHDNPSHALSDAKQQITPTCLRDTLDAIPTLFCRSETASKDKEQASELAWLRAEIDELDDQLWDSIARRMDVSRRIGEWKKANHVAPLQPERYRMIVEQREQWAQAHGLSPDFAKALFDSIHAESLRHQE